MNRSRSFTVAAALLASSSLTAFAAEPDDEIVVTASRVPLSLNAVGSAVDIITADDIARRPRFDVSDLLREVPGVAVNRSGPMGELTQVRLRGAEANQTLVFINGIEAGDPFNNSEFDFANLLSDDVARIEVVRGPQSALYGAQAIGGVINIITTEGQGPARFKLEGEGGSFGTYHLTGATSGGDDVHYAASASYLDTRGISMAIGGKEPDGHSNLTVNGRTAADLADNADVSLALRYVDARGKSDTQDFNFGSPTYGLVIDSNDSHRARDLFARGTGRLKLLDGAWEHVIAVALTDAHTDNYSNNAFNFGSFGRKVVASYQTDATLSQGAVTHTLLGYAEVKSQTFQNSSGYAGPQNQRKSTQDTAGVGEYRFDMADQLHVDGAVRYDANDLFQDATTYRLSSAWDIPRSGLKARASYGTGFAKPGFYELFGFDPTSFVGNAQLKPERSKGWDAGLDAALGAATFSATYFSTDLTDEIFTDFSVFPFTVRNQTGRSKRHGVETSARYQPTDALVLTASYSYIESNDATGKQEARRPRNVASAAVSYRFFDNRATVGVSADYNGKMTDVVFVPSIPSGVTTLKAFTLVTATASYVVMHNVELFGRIENLLDQRYQEVFSYNTPGLAAYGGVRVRFGG